MNKSDAPLHFPPLTSGIRPVFADVTINHNQKRTDMHFKAQTVKLAQVISDCLVVGVYESAKLTDSAQTLDDQSGKQLSTIIKQGDITGKIGQTLLIHQLPGNQAKRVLLVGCGKKPELGERQYREILGHAAKALLGTGARTAVNCLMELPIKGQDPHWKARQVVEISHASRYRFEQLKSQKTNDESPLEEITPIFLGPPEPFLFHPIGIF